MKLPSLTSNKKLLVGGAALFLIVVTCWMFRYEIRVNSKGQFVRINRFTGEVATIVGSTLVVAQSPHTPPERGPSEVHTWDAIPIPELGNVVVRVSGMWRDDKILYKVNVTPFSEAIKRAVQRPHGTAALTVLFEDENGFGVATVDIKITGMTCITDGKGGFMGVEEKGAHPLSFDSYSRIKTANVRWSAFPAASAEDCVRVTSWDVQDRDGGARLLLEAANSCDEPITLRAAVKLWDANDRPLGSRTIELGTILAREQRGYVHDFAPPVLGVALSGLR